MITYSPVTMEGKSALNAFDALWMTHQPANWEMPTKPELPPQEMLLDLLCWRDLSKTEEYEGVPI